MCDTNVTSIILSECLIFLLTVFIMLPEAHGNITSPFKNCEAFRSCGDKMEEGKRLA